MLAVDSLTIADAGHPLIGPVSFKVNAGESLVVMGETGAGKSLIAQAIMGALPGNLVANGEIYLNDERVDNLNSAVRQSKWGRELAMLPQEPWRALDPLMRSFSQVQESGRFVARDNISQSRKRANDLFRELDLQGSKRKRPGSLSGGMGQRVAFAAALAGGAELLLADEPTKGLDSQRVSTVVEHLNQVALNGGALVVITHDVTVARSIGGRLLVLKDGEVVETGKTIEVLENPSHEYTRALVAADPAYWEDYPPNAPQDDVMTLEELVVGRKGVALTNPMNLAIPGCSRIAIEGPSGKGKTTLLDTLAGLIKPVAGSVNIKQKFSKTDIQKVYQDPPAAFAANVSLRKSLVDVARLHSVPWQRVMDMLEQLKVFENILERKPANVSGGELQRLAIARALMVKPKLLLADEPTSRLDPLTQKLTMRLLAASAAQSQTAVILVTHDSVLARKWTDMSLQLD